MKILTKRNIEKYSKGIIKKTLKLKDDECSIQDAEEVTEQTYVNYIFRIKAFKPTVFYIRQSRDHVKAKPEHKVDPKRISFEVRVLNLLNSIKPGVVPEVITFDRRNNSILLADIRGDKPLLVYELISGNAHPETGTYFGEVIATYHKNTIDIDHKKVRGSEKKNRDAVNFHMGMRLDPAIKLFKKETNALLAVSKKALKCLVMGDLASKNIIVHGDKIRFLDLERAFKGDPAFDLAFLFCHYLIEIKPEKIEDSIQFIKKFMESYMNVMSNVMNYQQLKLFENRVLRFLGITILYRLFGFYLVVHVKRNKNAWTKIAQKMLKDTRSTDLVGALKRYVSKRDIS